MKTQQWLTGISYVLILCGSAGAQGVVTTVAGTDLVLNLDGQPALTTALSRATGVTLDNAGNPVFWAGGCTLVRIGTDGKLSVLAGNGICSQYAETPPAGPATATAQFQFDTPVAFDAAGSLYVAVSCYVLKVTAGTVSPFASLDCSHVITSLARDAAGNIYAADVGKQEVIRFNPDGTSVVVAGTGVAGLSGDGGPATSAMLNFPEAIAFDAAGNMYISDENNQRIRKVTPGGTISTVLTGVQVGPGGLAVTSSGVLYFAGNFSGSLYRFSGGTGATDITPAGLSIASVAVDGGGNLVVADSNARVLRISAATGTATVIAGNASIYSAEGTAAILTPIRIAERGGLAVAPDGTIYFSETALNRVRKVSHGIITTAAGTGVAADSGDGGPGPAAALNSPTSLAVDSGGNLYISESGIIRKLTPSGTISTFYRGSAGAIAVDQAGNLYTGTGSQVMRLDGKGNATVVAGTGALGYSGDGGPATAAKLSATWALAFDYSGNLLIADTGNWCIRKVTPQGIISTVPGLPAGYFPTTAVTADSSGNIYTSNGFQGVIRISPDGTSTGWYGYGSALGDGKLASSVSFRSGLDQTGAQSGIGPLTADTKGNLFISDGINARIREVLATPPGMTVSRQSLSLSGPSGGAPVVQSLTVQGDLTGLDFQVSSNASWLNSDASTGSTPRVLSISADPSGLAPGSYNGTVTITPVAALPAGIAVAVTFTVGPAQPPQLAVDRPNLSFAYPKGSSARSIIEMVSNSGGGTLSFAVSVSTNASGNWLSVSPSAGTATPAAAVPVSVTADPTGLSPGTYSGTVNIVPASGSPISVPVIMTLSPVSQGLLLTQTGMSFTGVAQGGIVPPQTFGVVNTGTGSLAWNASTSTLSGGKWLMASPSSGSSDPAAAAPQVTVTVNPAGLTPGDYYGLVRIDAPGAANTPQVVTAFLQVLPAGSDPGAVVQPTEVVYMHQSADFLYYAAPSQNLTIYNVSGSQQTFRTDYTPSSDHSGAADLVVLPRLGQVNPSQPVSVLAQPIYAYAGTLTFEFSDGRVQPVKITNLVESSTTSGAIRTGARPLDASSCTPTKLMPAVTTLPQSFTVSAGWPVALSVNVADDCGNPHLSGTVTVNFSNGDPALTLHSLNNGTWQGTWATTTNTQQISLNIDAENPVLGISGTREVVGSLGSAKDPPAFTQAQLVSAANPVSFAPIAPGSIISIYGDRLAEDSEAAQAIPLPTQLGNATVIFGDHRAPLFYGSQGQINAAVPFELAANTTQQLLIQRGLTYSYPIPVDVAPAQPGVFTASGLAIAFDYRGTSAPFLVTTQAPATAGDVLVLYCGGLGMATQSVMDGVASPGVTTQNPVTVTIGGNSFTAAYSGLVAGLVGLYQVNFTVPPGIAPGSSVPLSLTVAGQISPAVNLPLR